MGETKYGEGKYLVCREKEKRRIKRRKLFGERKYSFVCGGEEKQRRKRRQHLEKENIFCGGEGEGGQHLEKEN